jgi:hypothetical protein
LNTEAAWKEYLGTLGEWTASCEYHWYTDGATPEVRVSADDLDLLTDSLLCMFYIDIRAASLMAISGVGILDADAVNTPIGGIVGGSLGLKGTGRLRAVSV